MAVDQSVTSPLVTTDWLAGRLADGRSPDLAIVDASWYLPSDPRNARNEYLACHIPDAVFFDIDAVADHETSLPHMLPAEGEFAAAVEAMGVSKSQHIVVYDGAGLFSAARVWWTFRAFGAARVSVLDGGLPAWLAEGRPVESGSTVERQARFDARLTGEAIASAEDVSYALGDTTQVVDVRPAGRFRGHEAEPRAGVRRGHMPGAINLPSSHLIERGRLKPPEQLSAVLSAAGVDRDRPIITSCGSGVTAAILALALAQLGAPAPRLYDGSWAEWGADQTRPVVVDAPLSSDQGCAP